MGNFWKDIWDSKGRSLSKDLLWLCGREHLNIKWDSKRESGVIRDLLKLQSTDKILEVGCGAGYISREFKGFDFKGVDYSEPLINKHKELFPSHDVQTSESANLPFEDNQFDVLYCSGTFQYLPNEEYCRKSIEEFIRVTKRAILILDIKVEPTNPNHYCLPKESFEEYGFKIYDGTYEELHPNYNALLELK